MNTHLIPYVETLHRLADSSADVILPYFRTLTRIDNKTQNGDYDPVTDADRAAELTIRHHLSQWHPDHAVLGEEFASRETEAGMKSPYRWVIDPIDGTRAFIFGLPTWGTLIGLEKNGTACIGMMNQPVTRERFWCDGEASYMRTPDRQTTRLRTRKTDLETARLSTTSPDMFKAEAERAAFAALDTRVQERRYGGDCYAYCLLAAGHIDIVIEAGLKPYDIVALIPIIEQAGGVVTDWSGGPANSGGRVIACGNADLHGAAIDVIANA